MLPSSKRLTKSLFKNVIEKGKSLHSPLFTLRLLKNGGKSRFSVTVSKKVARSAVDRNRIRRRLYSAVSSIYPKIHDDFHGIILAKEPADKASFEEIFSGLESAFVKSGLLK